MRVFTAVRTLYGVFWVSCRVEMINSSSVSAELLHLSSLSKSHLYCETPRRFYSEYVSYFIFERLANRA